MPPVKLPFSGMMQRTNELMDTTLAKFVGKIVWFIIAGAFVVALYAGKAKVHEVIAADPNVVLAMTKALAAEHKATAIDQLLTIHSSEITTLHASDEKLATALDGISKTVQHTDLVLATVSQRQEDGQREQMENIHRLDASLNALAKK